MGLDMGGVCKVLARFWAPPSSSCRLCTSTHWCNLTCGTGRQAASGKGTGKVLARFWRFVPLPLLPLYTTSLPSARRSSPTQFCNLWQRERGESSANQKARICSSGQPAMPWFSWCQVVMVRGALVLVVVTPVKCQQNTRPGKEKGAKSSFCLPLRWDCQSLYSLVWFTFKICNEMVKWSKVCSLKALIQAAKNFAWMSLVRWRGCFCSESVRVFVMTSPREVLGHGGCTLAFWRTSNL